MILSRTGRGDRLRRHFHRNDERLLELAFAVGTLRDGSGFEPLFDQVAGTAIGALLLNGLAPGHEVAFGIAVAAEERLALLGTPLHHFAFRAIGAGNTDGLLLDVLAFRIRAAGREFAEAPVLQHQIAAALRALLVKRRIRFLLRPADLLGGFAIRVSGAGIKLSEAALLQHHHAPAIFAILFGILLSQPFGAGWIGRKLARVGALRVPGASDKFSELAPLDHHRFAALFAGLAGGLLHALDVGHVAFGVFQVFLE